MSRKPSLNHQMHLRMEDLNMIGNSRHEAKKQYKEMGISKNPTKTVGIYSYNTYETYKQTSKEFIRFIKAEYPHIRDINDIGEQHISKYLKERESLNMSAWTVSKDMTALNKLFNTSISKKDLDLKKRSLKDIKRSRGKKINLKYNESNYKYQIALAKGTGARRQSILKIRPKDFEFNKDNEPIKVYLKEKGGRKRKTTILKEYRSILKELLEDKEKDQALFNSYTKDIDNHSFRGEYTAKRYKELVEEKGQDMRDYKGYDKELLSILSQDLGHNRLNVVIDYYLNKETMV